MSTEQLKALRDAAESIRKNTVGHDAQLRYAAIQHAAISAITSLEAAAKAKEVGPCFRDNGDRINEQFRAMTDALESAEQAQQPAYAPALTPFSQPIPVQPAPEDVPPMPLPVGYNTIEGVRWTLTDQHEELMRKWAARDKALHAACVRIAQEREEAKAKVTRLNCAVHYACKDADERIAEAIARAEEYQRGQTEALCAVSKAVSERDKTYGKWRLALAGQERLEHERDEARRELEAERAGRPGSINAMTITSLRERLGEAVARADKAEAECHEARALAWGQAYLTEIADSRRWNWEDCFSKQQDRLEYWRGQSELRETALKAREAELAALRGQEPVAWRYKHRLGYAFSWTHPGYGTREGRSSQALYAAPVPPPDSVPREQHEAALQELHIVRKRLEQDDAAIEAELAQARREAGWSLVGAAQQAVLALGYDTECRIRNAISKDCGCAGCHRKWAKERLEAAIRALAEKGGEVGKP